MVGAREPEKDNSMGRHEKKKTWVLTKAAQGLCQIYRKERKHDKLEKWWRPSTFSEGF